MPLPPFLSLSLSLSLSSPSSVTPLPECTVATQLLEAIKEKKAFDHLTSILDTVSSVQPELDNDRDSELCCHLVATYIMTYIQSTSL